MGSGPGDGTGTGRAGTRPGVARPGQGQGRDKKFIPGTGPVRVGPGLSRPLPVHNPEYDR